MKTKICGLRRPEDIRIVNKYLPDYVGFVFAGTKRRIDEETARELKQELETSIRVVGVFVNEPINQIRKLCEKRIIDVIQLHGEESALYIKQLKSLVGNEVIKAVRVQRAEDIITAVKLPCDYVLLDTYVPDEYGGSGLLFDHGLISSVDGCIVDEEKGVKKPFFLAGGLTPFNASEISKKVQPYGMDISSGVEIDGFKDEDKINQFLSTVRTFK